MIDVCVVANYFLSQSPMTHKKLQKLCYYAQAWHCALFNEPLFVDEIQAWVHGPVVVSLYPLYADYGLDEITQRDFDDSSLPDNAVNVLDAVYSAYGGFTGDELERLTHSETPWQQARGNLEPWEVCTNVISCDVMRDYYAAKYTKAKAQ